VAVTRARDRLYLAADVDLQGRMKRGSRSLAALIPASLAASFTEAHATGADTVVWQSEHGRFVCAVCRPAQAPRHLPDVAAEIAGMPPPAVVRPVEPSGLVPRPASTVWLPVETDPGGRAPRRRRSEHDVDDRL